MDNKLKRAPGIDLTGFMGSGKTTTSRGILGRSFGMVFHRSGCRNRGIRAKPTIAQLFESRGEPEFRRIETAMHQKRDAQSRMRLAFRHRPGRRVFHATSQRRIAGTPWDLSFALIARSKKIEQRIPDPSSRPLARDTDGFRKVFMSSAAPPIAGPITASIQTATLNARS